jgi:hypothetical protein
MRYKRRWPGASPSPRGAPEPAQAATEDEIDAETEAALTALERDLGLRQ